MNRRSAFTLIELLIVIAIIALLAALTIGAVYVVRGSQEKNLTELTIQKLERALDQQWKAVVEDAKKEFDDGLKPTTMADIKALMGAAYEPRRAKVLYVKLRLKQELPASFYDALHPSGLRSSNAPNVTDLGNFPNSPNGTAKTQYYAALQNLTVSATPQDGESGAMLYLILKSNRRGSTFNIEEAVDRNFIGDKVIGSYGTFKVLRDSWGNTLRYYQAPYYCPNNELSDKPYAPAANLDHLDPEKRFHTVGGTAQNAFNTLISNTLRLHPMTTQPRNMVPVIASAGKDGIWPDGNDLVQSRLYMNLATDNADGGAGDNIYSYRLRQSGARGD